MAVAFAALGIAIFGLIFAQQTGARGIMTAAC